MTEMAQLQGYYYQEQEAAARARTLHQDSSRQPRHSLSSTPSQALHYSQELHRQQQAQLRRAQAEADVLELQRRAAAEHSETEYLHQLAVFQQQQQAQHHHQQQQQLNSHQQHHPTTSYYLTPDQQVHHHHLSAQHSPIHPHFPPHMELVHEHLQLGVYPHQVPLPHSPHPLPHSPHDPQYQMAQQQAAYLAEQRINGIKYESPPPQLAHISNVEVSGMRM